MRGHEPQGVNAASGPFHLTTILRMDAARLATPGVADRTVSLPGTEKGPKGVDEELWEENGGVSWFHVWSSRNLNSPTTQQQRSKRRYVATVVTIGQVELSSL